MPMIWVTSDLHFNHDREFIWKARGFNSVDEMNHAIVDRYNSVVKPEDEVFILGDLMLGRDTVSGLDLISSLNGHKTIIRGNHDSKKRIDAYEACGWQVYNSLYLDYKKYLFYLSHYPTMTGNLEVESMHQTILNLFGHTHQTSNFYNDIPYCFHVGVDSHNCYPISLDSIIEEIKAKYQECKEQL